MSFLTNTFGSITGSNGGDGSFLADFGRTALERGANRALDAAGLGPDQGSGFQLGGVATTPGFSQPVTYSDFGISSDVGITGGPEQRLTAPDTPSNQRAPSRTGLLDVNFGSGNFTLILIAIVGYLLYQNA